MATYEMMVNSDYWAHYVDGNLASDVAYVSDVAIYGIDDEEFVTTDLPNEEQDHPDDWKGGVAKLAELSNYYEFDLDREPDLTDGSIEVTPTHVVIDGETHWAEEQTPGVYIYTLET